MRHNVSTVVESCLEMVDSYFANLIYPSSFVCWLHSIVCLGSVYKLKGTVGARHGTEHNLANLMTSVVAELARHVDHEHSKAVYD